MTVSVIIPVYQAERFLVKAVKSACEQKEASEIILVEDGSKDKSLEICKRLEVKYSPRVKLYRHHDGGNHGAGASRNLGISKAECEFIGFLDADDYYLKGRFEKDLEYLRNNLMVDGVYNALGVEIYDEGEKERIKRDLTTVRFSIPPDKLFENMGPIGACGYFSCDAVTLRRSIFDKVGLFDESLKVGQDTHMWIKMAAVSTLVAGVIDRPVAIRGVHRGNRVRDYSMYHQYRPLLFSSLLDWAKCNRISLSRRALLWCCLYDTYHYSVKAEKNSGIVKRIKIYYFLIKNGIQKPYLFLEKRFIYSLLTGWI